jgi:single-stranded-DNA-specific exonuclease
MEKRWNLLSPNEQDVARLYKELGISSILCKILVERGITNLQEAKHFFRPSLDSLHDPLLMKDMAIAVDRIMKAMIQRERILVYGDYDVDGTTAVGCMFRFLCKIYEKDLVDFYIPHRYHEGYGVSKQGVGHAINNGFRLVIALDCGIKSSELIRYAGDHGVDFIVCDHHIPDEILPPAVAILNPKQKDCPYPYKELCGCGVGLKLITALVQQSGLPDELWMECLDLAATAVAADIVPMTGENRVIAYFGLKRTNENPSVAMKALMDVSGMKGKVLLQHLVFMIAPRVNAAGRMDDARKVVNLFIENDFEKAAGYARELHSDNADRKEADLTITKEALTLIREYETSVKRKSTVVYQPHWHKGVVGIVASRLIEHYYRPTIVLTKSGDVVAGSARSIPGFNIHDGLEQCKDLLLGFGGHYFAAGMTMRPENVEAFSTRFNEVVEGLLQEHYFTPEIRIDAEVSLAECNRKFYDIVTQMEPFGPENPQPVLVARGLLDTGYSKIVKELHLRLVVKQGNAQISGIGFNLSEKYAIVSSGKPFDVVFTLDENEWQGNVSLQMKVIDIKAAGERR